MGRYYNNQAKKHKYPAATINEIHIGDSDTKIVSTGQGTYKIVSPNSCINVDSNGNVDISGSTSVTISGKNLDFSELPDRYIRENGIPWTTVANNTQVIAAIPIRIKGKKVYIPCLDIDID